MDHGHMRMKAEHFQWTKEIIGTLNTTSDAQMESTNIFY